jgi:hypothetical protein
MKVLGWDAFGNPREEEIAMPVEKPTDEEVEGVARAMDVDEKLDWESKDHDMLIEIENALKDARHMIIGVRAVAAPEAKPEKRVEEPVALEPLRELERA